MTPKAAATPKNGDCTGSFGVNHAPHATAVNIGQSGGGTKLPRTPEGKAAQLAQHVCARRSMASITQSVSMEYEDHHNVCFGMRPSKTRPVNPGGQKFLSLWFFLVFCVQKRGVGVLLGSGNTIKAAGFSEFRGTFPSPVQSLVHQRIGDLSRTQKSVL